MSVFLSKVFSLLVFPLSLGLFLLIAGLVLRRWRPRLGLAATLLGLLVLWVPSTPACSAWLLGSLEAPYPPQTAEAALPADAIVVLGGGLSAPAPAHPYPDLNDAADRVLHAARLYRAGKAPRIIVSGGALPWLGDGGPEAPAMQALLESWGVPPEAILVEPGSQNTHQNAVETAALLDREGLGPVLLVTSAFHMRRALATFRTAGVRAIPAPTDHTALGRAPSSLLRWFPDAEALARSTRAVKEYVGYAVYRWTGRIDPDRASLRDRL